MQPAFLNQPLPAVPGAVESAEPRTPDPGTPDRTMSMGKASLTASNRGSGIARSTDTGGEKWEDLPASEGSGEEVQRMTMHGEFFHAMISYRVSSEGDGGTGLSGAINDSMCRVSMERGFRFPPHLWGEWPSFAKLPSFGMGKIAKVYLDTVCLEEGEPWEAGSTGGGGFAGALRCSIVFVPLLSFTAGGGGSLGQMMRLAEEDFCDNVLLEFTVALGIWRSKQLQMRAILPVLVGEKNKRGIYSTFPFSEVSRLPDTPSEKTNAAAANILHRFGLHEEAARVHRGTVRGVVSRILSFQGVQLSNEGVHTKAVRSVAEQVLRVARKHVLEGMEAFLLRGRHVKNLTNGTPCGYEVLEWLNEVGLGRYGTGFAASRVDSLLIAANLIRPEGGGCGVSRIVADTERAFASQLGERGGGGDELSPAEGQAAGEEGGGGVMPGDIVELELAVRGLRGDARARTMKDRLFFFTEESRHGMRVAMTRLEGLETVMASRSRRGGLAFVMSFNRSFRVFPSVLIWSSLFTVMPHDSDLMFMTLNFLHEAGGIFTFFFLTAFLKLPPPTSWEVHITIFLCSTMLLYLGGWLVESLHFTGDNQVPDTPLRHVRYPLHFGFQFVFSMATRLRWGWIHNFPTLFQALLCLIYMVACFLGEDPNSTVMAWVMLGVLTQNVLAVVSGFGRKKKAMIAAVELVKPEKEAFVLAWEAAMAADGSEAAARGLTESCREVSIACVKEWRAFEPTVPRFGPHVWWVAVPLVREGPFTRSGKPRQAVNDLDILFQQARVLNLHFQDWVKSWAGWGNGVQYVPGPVKHARRVIEKCIRAYGRDSAAMTDLVRCTVICPTLQRVFDFFLTVRERSDNGGIGMLRIRRVKNRLAPDYDAEANSVGYRDLSILVEVGWLERGGTIEFVPVKDWGKETSRHICEIQVHVAAVYEVKSGGSHDKYVMYRDLMST